MSSYKPFDADTLIETAAAMLQIRLAPEYRRGVRDNLKTAAKMAIVVEQVKLEEAAEPAPVYRP
jgi:hypothetical protein